MNKEPKKAIGYVRVSTDVQDHKRQKDEIEIYSKDRGFILVAMFEDVQSGSDYDDRKGLQELLEYFDDNPDVKIVIFDEVSRMGRDTAQQCVTYKLLQKRGVRVYTRGKGEFGSNKEDQLLFTMLSAIAEFEKQTIIDRTSSGRRKVVRDGNVQISIKPYGYNLILTEKKDRVVTKRQSLEINKEEAKNVKKMFNIIKDGGFINDVIRHLKEKKIPSPTGNPQWGASTILRILHNSMYYGEWKFGKFFKNGKTKYSLDKRKDKDLITVQIPPIITRDLYDEVQKQLELSRVVYSKKKQKIRYLLKGGPTYCNCGRMLEGTLSSGTKVLRRLYRCPQRNIEGVSVKTCPLPSFEAEFVEKVLILELKKRIEDPENFKEYKLNILENYKSPKDELEERIKKLNRRIEADNKLLKGYYEKSLQLEIENKDKASVFNELGDNKLKEVSQSKKDIQQCKTELDKLKRKDIDLGLFDDIKKGLKFISNKEAKSFSQGDQDKKLDFIKKYIKRMDVKYDKKGTDHLRANIKELRKLGLFAKGNKDALELYNTVFHKDHQLRVIAMFVMRIEVLFINNFKVEIKLPYWHMNPNLAINYLSNNNINWI